MYPKKMKTTSEKTVVDLWRKQVQRMRSMIDSDGRILEVVYPGRLNDSRGPDFKDAVIVVGNDRKSGGIEIHTRSSGWLTHGHHRNPVYNQVVLHVALEQDRTGKTILQNGQAIPTVILENGNLSKASAALAVKHGLPCRQLTWRRKPDFLAKYLDKAGDQRWAVKTARYAAELSYMEADQCLYQGILEGLGYSKNKIPFRELACHLPISILNYTAQGEYWPDQYRLFVEALLLGKAGFLSSSFRHLIQELDQVDELERIWQSFPQSDVMSSSQWELFRVRPDNHPIRRIIALSCLLQRFRGPGILPSLLDLIRQCPVDCPVFLEKALVVRIEDYQGYNKPEVSDLKLRRVLLGRVRAAEIIVNVLLPFAQSWSQMSSDLALGSRALELYRQYPCLERNSVERHMIEQLSLPRNIVNSARRQQGLLHIYRTYCVQGKCAECFFCL